jgi:hypothetical protein
LTIKERASGSMIKLGTEKELLKISNLNKTMQKSIQSDIKILDENYGINRDIDKDLGGYVVILDVAEDITELNKSIKLSIKEDIFEYAIIVDNYIKALYILSSDFAVVLYIRKSIAPKNIFMDILSKKDSN